MQGHARSCVIPSRPGVQAARNAGRLPTSASLGAPCTEGGTVWSYARSCRTPLCWNTRNVSETLSLRCCMPRECPAPASTEKVAAAPFSKASRACLHNVYADNIHQDQLSPHASLAISIGLLISLTWAPKAIAPQCTLVWHTLKLSAALLLLFIRLEACIRHCCGFVACRMLSGVLS